MRKPVTRKPLVAFCTNPFCFNEFLDKEHGHGMRVMHWGKHSYYCTTCHTIAAKDVHRKPTTKEL